MGGFATALRADGQGCLPGHTDTAVRVAVLGCCCCCRRCRSHRRSRRCCSSFFHTPVALSQFLFQSQLGKKKRFYTNVLTPGTDCSYNEKPMIEVVVAMFGDDVYVMLLLVKDRCVTKTWKSLGDSKSTDPCTGLENSIRAVFYKNKYINIESSRPEWCISSMIYSGDTPFWWETLELFILSVSLLTPPPHCPPPPPSTVPATTTFCTKSATATTTTM